MAAVRSEAWEQLQVLIRVLTSILKNLQAPGLWGESLPGICFIPGENDKIGKRGMEQSMKKLKIPAPTA